MSAYALVEIVTVPAVAKINQKSTRNQRDGINKTPENSSSVHKLEDLSSKTHQKKKEKKRKPTTNIIKKKKKQT